MTLLNMELSALDKTLFYPLLAYISLFAAGRVSSVLVRVMAKKKSLAFKSYMNGSMPETLVVDCSHPSAIQLTHNLKQEKQRQLMDLSLRGDSSTDAVINAAKEKHETLSSNAFVSTNHFDVDSFLSVWCAMNVDLAIKYEKILRIAAKIG